jgi:hypothetical protein
VRFSKDYPPCAPEESTNDGRYALPHHISTPGGLLNWATAWSKMLSAGTSALFTHEAHRNILPMRSQRAERANVYCARCVGYSGGLVPRVRFLQVGEAGLGSSRRRFPNTTLYNNHFPNTNHLSRKRRQRDTRTRLSRRAEARRQIT